MSPLHLIPIVVGSLSQVVMMSMYRNWIQGERIQRNERSQRRVPVNRNDVLPDDILLDVFDFYLKAPKSRYPTSHRKEVEAWHILVHVCRRWRGLVLESPLRLNLRVFCTPKTPAKGALDIWPTLPIIINGSMDLLSSTDDTIAALGQHSRVREIDLLGPAKRQLKEVLAAMQVPFPELTVLRLHSDCETPPIPDSFLGGSAPHLRYFHLTRIPFPGLPKLISSAYHLVQLGLHDIPHSGYISPDAMATLLSMLSALETLSLEFQSPQSRPDWETRRPPLSRRFVFPTLRYFSFKGVTEYLEDLVTGIDTLQLDEMDIRFFNQIDFDIPQLAQFIHCTPKPKSNARVQFDDYFARVRIYSPGSNSITASIAVSCKEPDWQLSSLEQVCNSSLRPLSTVEVLYMEHLYQQLTWNWEGYAIENSLWLQLLLPFTAVKNLYLSEKFAPGIAAALQELIGNRIMEVLPSLQNIFVEWLEPSGPFQENIKPFVVARQLSGHPIVISFW